MSPAPELLTLREAARILRLRDSVARRWLQERRLVRVVAGRRRVLRSALLAALEACPCADEPAWMHASPTPSPASERDSFWDLPTTSG